jgi:hypothetical protein
MTAQKAKSGEPELDKIDLIKELAECVGLRIQLHVPSYIYIRE